MTSFFLATSVLRADDLRVCSPPSFRYGAQVFQAQEMVCVQARCGMTEALTLMTDLAEVTDCTIEDIAALVVDGWVGFN